MSTAKIIELLSVQGTLATCRSCGASVRWAKTAAGKHLLINSGAEPLPRASGGYLLSTDHVHWATCPNSGAYRRHVKDAAPSERID
jgi:hypothetical protein